MIRRRRRLAFAQGARLADQSYLFRQRGTLLGKLGNGCALINGSNRTREARTLARPENSIPRLQWCPAIRVYVLERGYRLARVVEPYPLGLRQC